MNPQTRSDLETYVLQSLGSPLVDVNITQDQMDNMVDDAILFFQEYYWDGVKRAYYTYVVQPGDVTAGYITIPDYIYAISYVMPVGALNLSNLKFNMQPLTAGYQLLYDALNPNQFGHNLVYFEQIAEHMNLIQDMLIAETRFSYNRLDGNLYIHDKSNLIPGQVILMECFASLDLTQPSKIWGERLFKQYCVAKCKFQWAVNLSKYQGIQLPGGVTVDAAAMKADAKEEIEKIEQWIINSMNPLEMYIG